MTRAILVTAFVGAVGCAAIGDPGSFPEELPNGGTGLFRVLDRTEVGMRRGPGGTVLDLEGDAFGSGMVVDGFLFYAAGERLADPPERPSALPAGDVFWGAFGPRRIFRAPGGDTPGFDDRGEVVLEGEAGGEVYDPWVVRRGREVWMFYVADGSLRAAMAESVDGTFTPVDDGPLVDGALLPGPPSRPTAVLDPDDEARLLVYFEAAGDLYGMAQDGGAFMLADGDPSTEELDPLLLLGGDDEEESAEVARGAPGAARWPGPDGSAVVRLYFESRRSDGSRLAYVAGSRDGLIFERHPRPVAELTDVRAPAPVLVGPRTTLLYGHVGFVEDGQQVRALAGLVAPGSVRFTDDDEL